MSPSTPAALAQACPKCEAAPGAACLEGVWAVDDVHDERAAASTSRGFDVDARERILFHAARLFGIASMLREPGPRPGVRLAELPAELDEIAAQLLSAIGAGDLVPPSKVTP